MKKLRHYLFSFCPGVLPHDGGISRGWFVLTPGVNVFTPVLLPQKPEPKKPPSAFTSITKRYQQFVEPMKQGAVKPAVNSQATIPATAVNRDGIILKVFRRIHNFAQAFVVIVQFLFYFSRRTSSQTWSASSSSLSPSSRDER